MSPAVNILTTAMSANLLYVEIFKILSGGPSFSLPRLLLLLCSVLVRIGYFIGLSKTVIVPQTRNRFLGFLSDSILQAFLQFYNIRESSLSPFLIPFSSAEQCLSIYASAIRRQGYLFLFSCPGCSVIHKASLPRYLWGKSCLSAHQSCL